MRSRLRQAARAAGDTLPGNEYLSVMIRQWEHDAKGISERYRRHYCHAFQIPADQFGSPGAERPARTIAITARSSSRLARLNLRYPAGTRRSWLSRFRTRYPDAADHPDYDAELALELIGRTSELPASKHDLIVILTEYRHALHDLATQSREQQPCGL